MSEFKREERFIVLKRKNLDGLDELHLRQWLTAHSIPTSECVVVESDWPEYETVWSLLKDRVEGRPNVIATLQQRCEELEQQLAEAANSAGFWGRATARANQKITELQQRLAALEAGREPVRYEYRFRIPRNTLVWSPWSQCDRDRYENFNAELMRHPVEYEVRALYTTPQPAPERPTGDIAVSGVSRSGEDGRELLVYFSEPLSDDDVRIVHDMLRENLAGRDPYRGARDDMEIWKRRALEAERDLQRLCEQANAESGPTHMGEPVLPIDWQKRAEAAEAKLRMLKASGVKPPMGFGEFVPVEELLQPAPVQAVPDCEHCDGVGERMIYIRPTPDPQDAYEAWGECPDCHGSGNATPMPAVPDTAHVFVPKAFLRFLFGEEAFEGVWFGEKHPSRPGQFWWREHIKYLLNAAPSPTSSGGAQG